MDYQKQLRDDIQQIKHHLQLVDKTLWGDKEDLDRFPGIAYEVAASRRVSERNFKVLLALLTASIANLAALIKVLLG